MPGLRAVFSIFRISPGGVVFAYSINIATIPANVKRKKKKNSRFFNKKIDGAKAPGTEKRKAPGPGRPGAKAVSKRESAAGTGVMS